MLTSASSLFQRGLSVALLSTVAVASSHAVDYQSAGSVGDGALRVGFIYSLLDYDLDTGSGSSTEESFDDPFGAFVRIQGELDFYGDQFVHSGFTFRYRYQEDEDLAVVVDSFMLDWHLGYGMRFDSLRWETEASLGAGWGELELDLGPGGGVISDVNLMYGVGLHTNLIYNMGSTWQAGVGLSLIYAMADYDMENDTVAFDAELLVYGAEANGFIGLRF